MTEHFHYFLGSGLQADVLNQSVCVSIIHHEADSVSAPAARRLVDYYNISRGLTPRRPTLPAVKTNSGFILLLQ